MRSRSLMKRAHASSSRALASETRVIAAGMLSSASRSIWSSSLSHSLIAWIASMDDVFKTSSTLHTASMATRQAFSASTTSARMRGFKPVILACGVAGMARWPDFGGTETPTECSAPESVWVAKRCLLGTVLPKMPSNACAHHGPMKNSPGWQTWEFGSYSICRRGESLPANKIGNPQVFSSRCRAAAMRSAVRVSAR